MKRIVKGAFALTLVLGLAGAAQSQVVCSKTNNKGKVKFKLRDVCKSNEVVAQDFATLVPADVVTADQLPAAPGQLATLADIPTVRQSEVYGWSNSNGVSMGDTPTAIPLDGSDPADPTFTTTAASTDVVITLAAECTVRSPIVGDWLDMDLFLDGVALPPTDQDDDAFCGAKEANASSWSTNSMTVVVEDVGPGVHTITATANTSAAAASGDFYDLSLSVVTVED